MCIQISLNGRISRHLADARSGGISVSFFRNPSPSGGAERAKKGRTNTYRTCMLMCSNMIRITQIDSQLHCLKYTIVPFGTDYNLL
jgi:uncharacterized protein YbbK (DUF523 family)